MPSDLFSVSHRAGGSRGVLTMRRLRATLRLMFDGRTADDIAGPVGDDRLDVEALRTVASRARSQYMLDRVLRRLPGRGDDGDRPLPASVGIPGGAALTLAFHIGLKLDASTIADVLETTPEQVGADLFQARRAIDLSLPVPCERFTATVSMLNDPALDPDERLQYISHTQSCDRCTAVVEALAALDVDLRAEVDTHESALPEAPLRARRSRRLLPVAALSAVTVVVIAGIVGLSGLLSGEREPVPLVAIDVSAPYTGWVLQQTMDGRLEALNLATREVRPLGATIPDGNLLRWPSFSPSFEWIAGWTQTPGESRISITNVDGDILHSLTFDQYEAYWYFVGWLSNDELLMASSAIGPPGETQDEFYSRVATESRLLAIDPTTGAERVLFQGNVASAIVSPDGTRVAITPPYDQRWPGQSFELRHMSDDGVGDLIATSEHRAVGAGMWAPDSSTFYFARIADEDIERMEVIPGQFISPTTRRYEQLELAALLRDGGYSSLWTAEPGEELEIATVSPDGQTIVVRSGSRQTSGYFRYVFWRIPAGGGEAEPFIESPHPNGVWSPDGATLLWPTVTNWYLAGDSGDVLGREIPDIAYVAYGSDWEPRTVYGELGPGPIGSRVLAWLAEDALPITTEAAHVVELQGQAAEPAPVANAGTGNRIVPGSTASPDGQYVTLLSADGDAVIWNTARRQGRRLLEGSEGGSWLPNGNGLLDTAVPRVQGEATRLIYYAPQFTRETDARYDFRQLNPAGLEELGSRYYAAPRLSPDQFNASFFVVDPDQQAVELWVAGWDTTPRQVLRWNVPVDRLLEPPLQAIWADERTLLLSQPGDWRDGLPRQVSLVRVVVSGDDVQVDRLVELGTRPRDEGVVLWEMELSPDGEQIAYRLRHFGELSADSGRSDALHVVPVADIGRPIELVRGAPGDGIAWSKDSRWLTAGIRGRIALMSVDGREFSHITPDGQRADSPVWMTTHEVWFSLDAGAGPEIWRVRVD